jgi:hypothetical protein
MPSTAATTDPLSHYEVLSTFWAAARTACGTDLRGQSLVNFDVLGPVPHGFVAELGSKLRPAGIENGLGQAGSGQSTRLDIADADAAVFPHEPRRKQMQEMLAAVHDLRVDGPYTCLASGTLGDRERPFVFAIDARRFDLFTRGERRQRYQSEIDTDLSVPMLSVFRDVDLQIQVPAATGVLGEAAGANLPGDRAAEPEPIPASQKDGCTAFQPNPATRLEGNPSQPLPATPSRPLAVCVARSREPLTDRLHGIRVQAQELTTTEGELDQIEARRPAPVVAVRSFLYLPAIIPDAVHRASLPTEMAARSRILDPVPIRQHHGSMVLDRSFESKTDAKFPVGIFTHDLPSAILAVADVDKAGYMTVVRSMLLDDARECAES